MQKRQFLLLISILLGFVSSLTAQTGGVLQGYVTQQVVKDSATMEKSLDTLLFAKVVVLETPYKAYTLTRTNRKYVITSVPAGTYTIQASTKDKSLRKTIEKVTVKDGDTTYLDINLSFDAILDTNRIVVRLTKETKDLGSLEAEKINKEVVSEVKGAEQIAKTGGSNVAGATKSISGVSVVGGKYVFIRGLSDRYSKTVLNNAEIPGLDPDRNSVQLDLFPSTFISSLDVIKTYSPEYPGDWAGGLLDLKTKTFPDSLSMTFSAGLGYNSQGSLNSNFASYKGGATDFLGFDDGTRKLPADIQVALDNGTLNQLFPSFPSSVESGERTAAANKLFSKQLLPQISTSLLDHNLTFTLGNKKTWLGKNQSDTLIKKKFGYFAGISYRKSFDFFDGGIKRRYSLTSPVDEIDVLNLERDFSYLQGTENVNIGTLFNVKYIPNKRNTLSANFIRNNGGQSRTESSRGRLFDEPGTELFINTLRYTERAMNTLQFIGSHDFSNSDSSKAFFANGEARKAVVDWTASYTLARQDEPDYRVSPYFLFLQDSSYFFNTSAVIPPTRFYRFMTEYVLDHKVNLSFARELKNKELVNFKAGLSNVFKSREFSEVRFELNSSSDDLNGVGGNVEELLADDRFEFNNFNFRSTYQANFQKSSQYQATQSISAGFLQASLPLTDKFSVLGGARVEITDLQLQSDNGDNADLFRVDVLPSINLNYALIDQKRVRDRVDTTKFNKRNLKLRLGYNKTLARPSFREIAPYAVDDFEQGVLVQGNPELDRTLIDNFDLRLEYYPRKLEIFSVSLFYKRLINPIELRAPSEGGGRNFKWSQGKEGLVYGVEFDAKKRLDFIHPDLSSMSVGTNITLSASAIDIDDVELNQSIRALDPQHADTRPLFGQSPYLINAFWELEPDTANQSQKMRGTVVSRITRGMLFRINYNVFGDRLARVTFGGAPDIYEVSRGDLGVVISKQFTDRIKLSIKASNLLNPEFKQVYKFIGDNPSYEQFNEQEYVFESYRAGIDVSASLSFQF